jgi:type II secretory pathway pseudopilin PulG
MEHNYTGIIFLIITGLVASAIANSKGRNAVGWFFGGFFFHIIGILIVAVLPNLTEQKRKEEEIALENRRLREQLIQEQIKTEAFRRHASARLDAHDEHLGVDTRSNATALPAPEMNGALPDLTGNDDLRLSAEPIAETFGQPLSQVRQGQVQPANGAASPSPSPSVVAARQWYFEQNGTTRGPYSDSQLVALIQSGEIVSTTLLWTEQIGWKKANEIKPLRPHLIA